MRNYYHDIVHAQNAKLRILIEDALAQWGPALDSQEPIDGATAVDYLAELLGKAQAILTKV